MPGGNEPHGPQSPTYSGSIERRRFLIGAGVSMIGLSPGARSALRVAGVSEEELVVKTIPRERPEERQNNDSDSTAAVGPTHRTYEPAVVSPDALTNHGDGEATDFEADSNDDGSLIEVGTEYDGPGFIDSLRTADLDDDGEDEEFGLVPGDPQIATGPDHHVAVINSELAVYNKDTGVETHRFRLEDWFANVIGDGDQFVDFLVFDPRGRYDPDAGRFYVSYLEYDLETDEGAFLLTVSSSDDPTADWTNYRIPPLENNGLVDFETLGFDSRAVYLTQNLFSGSLNEDTGGGGFFFSEASLVILDRADLLAGDTVDASHFRNLRDPNGAKSFTVQPAVMPGYDAGPFYLVNTEIEAFFVGQSDGLTLWRVEDPTGEPSVSNTRVSVDPYSIPPTAEQPDTDGRIDAGDIRLVEAVAYNPVDETLWPAHAVDGGDVAASRWYELDPSTDSVVQSGEFTMPDNTGSAFFPTVKARGPETVLVYSASGPDTFPRMDVAAQTDTSQPGELQEHVVVQEGETPYDYGADVMRWGDYNGIDIDPSSGVFWTIAQYAPPEEDKDDDAEYETRIVEVSLNTVD